MTSVLGSRKLRDEAGEHLPRVQDHQDRRDGHQRPTQREQEDDERTEARLRLRRDEHHKDCERRRRVGGRSSAFHTICSVSLISRGLSHYVCWSFLYRCAVFSLNKLPLNMAITNLRVKLTVTRK